MHSRHSCLQTKPHKGATEVLVHSMQEVTPCGPGGPPGHTPVPRRHSLPAVSGATAGVSHCSLPMARAKPTCTLFSEHSKGGDDDDISTVNNSEQRSREEVCITFVIKQVLLNVAIGSLLTTVKLCSLLANDTHIFPCVLAVALCSTVLPSASQY